MKQNELQDFNDLPNGWVITTLGKVLPISYGKGLTKDKRDKTGSYPVFGSSGQVGKHSKSLTRKPTLIIGRKGSVGEVYYSPVPCWPIDTTYYVEEQEELHLKFFLYFLKGLKIGQLDKSTAVPGLSRDDYNVVQVAVAPLDQQKLIVVEIEKQFSRLDEAIENLKRVKANLKRYKAAVLKAAVEGKLTEEWRKQNPDVEHASELLKRILAERKKKWEAEHPGKKYKEPASPDTTNLPELPKGWVWATLPQLGELNRGKSKHRPRNVPHLYGGHYPFVQTGDIKSATGVIREYKQTYSEEGLKQSRLWPKGTLCITIAANIADTAILGFDACFPDSVVGFISESENVDTRFVEYFFRTAKENIERFAPATAQKNINLEILNDVAIPLPPVREQQAIINEIEQRLSVTEEIEAAVEMNLKRAERLQQAILKKAFSGKLCPQDTNNMLIAGIEESVE
jgi:type I restriction enzyme S subunit